MKFNMALAGALIAGFAVPAVAQTTTTETYYLVQDVKTKKCTITQQKPTGTEWTMIGSDGTVYKTKTEAETAMKTTKVCETK